MNEPKIIEINGQEFVSAIDLHDNVLCSNPKHYKRDIENWFNSDYLFKNEYDLRKPLLEKDLLPQMAISTGGRPKQEYFISLELSKLIAINSDSRFKKEYVRWLLSLEDDKKSGCLFTPPQIEALMDLSRAMTLISIQKDVEKRHFNIYNDKYSWHNYRASLLDYNTNRLILAMKLVNKKHHSIRTSLLKLDANELIRIGVIDLMITLGKPKEYAVKVGNLCKSMAQKMKLGNIIWDDTIDNPLQINQSEVTERKQLLADNVKQLKQ